ncbi:uncharacterized protein [Phaseolus vulgaris]|uniref:uncharacterized protein isoform X2 n=1 Tax=Phaseolus vulgaris TaxID=3885 RepID=UPI0035CBA363
MFECQRNLHQPTHHLRSACTQNNWKRNYKVQLLQENAIWEVKLQFQIHSGSTRGNSRKIHCGDWAKRFFLIQKKKSLKAMKTTKTMKRNELIDM